MSGSEASTSPRSGLGVARSDQLQRIEQAGLVKQGRVFLLSLEPIRAELGRRWASRSELIWQTLERTLAKRMPLPDMFIRIDDATILAAIVSVDAYEGQVRCAEALRATLAFFLGRSADSDVSIERVSDLAGGEIASEPIDLMAPAPPPVTARREAAPASPDRWTPPLTGRRFDGTFLSERKGTVRLSFDIVPVWRLDQEIISAFMIRRALPAPLQSFDDHDRELMDHRLIDHLLPLLEEYRREGGVFALIIPGTFTSAAARRPRMELINRCAPVIDIMRQAVVLQVEGFGAGAPIGRISEMAAMMKPFFHVLTAGVGDRAEAEAAIRDYAFQGMAIQAGQMGQDQLEKLIRVVRRRTPNVLVHGLKATVDVDRLKALGVSHVSYLKPPDPAGSPFRPGASVPA
jgi:hypothetical protein